MKSGGGSTGHVIAYSTTRMLVLNALCRLHDREADYTGDWWSTRPDTSGPYYKRVTLRLMPITGGPAKVIAYVYGGQGTLNVPSWSPDGRMLAFVSNTDVY